MDSLFTFLKNKVAVNDKGELMKDDGSVMAGTHIGDLIQHAVRDRRRNLTPVGWSQFLNLLSDQNAPRMILNYDTLDELQHLRAPSLTTGLHAGPKPSRIPAPKAIKRRSVSQPTIKKEQPDAYVESRSRSRSLKRESPPRKRDRAPPRRLTDYVTDFSKKRKAKYV